MDDQKEPFSRLVGGSGTYADPYHFRSDLLQKINHIHPVGRYVPGQIAEAREQLAQTDVPDDVRNELEERLDDLEYRWHLGRAAHLVQQAYQPFKPEATAAKKRAEFLQQAHAARDAFYEFAQAHPAVHQKRRDEVPLIEVLMEKYKPS